MSRIPAPTSYNNASSSGSHQPFRPRPATMSSPNPTPPPIAPPLQPLSPTTDHLNLRDEERILLDYQSSRYRVAGRTLFPSTPYNNTTVDDDDDDGAGGGDDNDATTTTAAATTLTTNVNQRSTSPLPSQELQPQQPPQEEEHSPMPNPFPPSPAEFILPPLDYTAYAAPPAIYTETPTTPTPHSPSHSRSPNYHSRPVETQNQRQRRKFLNREDDKFTMEIGTLVREFWRIDALELDTARGALDEFLEERLREKPRAVDCRTEIGFEATGAKKRGAREEGEGDGESASRAQPCSHAHAHDEAHNLLQMLTTSYVRQSFNEENVRGEILASKLVAGRWLLEVRSLLQELCGDLSGVMEEARETLDAVREVKEAEAAAMGDGDEGEAESVDEEMGGGVQVKTEPGGEPEPKQEPVPERSELASAAEPSNAAPSRAPRGKKRKTRASD